MITKVAVTNWKKFSGKQEWSFDKGIQLVYGPNTSGKSSILEAIYFAFFGVDEQVDGNPTFDNNSHAVVTLDFISPDNCLYRIVRSYKKIKRKDESFTLYKLNNGKEEFVSEDPKKAIELYGTFEDIFTHVLFLKEGEIYRALSRMTNNLDEELAYLLNLQRFDVLRDKLKETRTKFIKKMKQNVKDDPTFLSEKEKKELEEQLNELHQQKRELEEERNKVRDKQKLAREKEKLTEKIKELEEEKKEYGEKIKTIRTKYENKENLPQFLEEKLQTLKRTKEKLEQKEAELFVEKSEQEGERKRIAKLIDEVTTFSSSGETTCPTCYQKVNPEILQEALSSFKNKIVKIDDLLTQLKYSIDELKEEIRRVEESVEIIKNELFELRNAKSKISSVQEEMNSLTEKLSSQVVKEDCQQFEKQLEEIERELSDINVKIGTVKKKLENSKQEGIFIDELEFQEKFVELVEKKLAEYKDELFESKLSEVKRTIKEKWSEIWKKEIWTIEFDDNLIPTISFKQAETTIQQNLRSFSASEKILLSVILRAAIVDKLLDVKTLILDDPSIFLDEKSVEIAARFYRELIDKNLVHQIIMTTFDAKFKELLKPEKVINLE